VCWWPERDGRRRTEIHHLQGGPGRKHDARNLLTLCERCHGVYHSGKIYGRFPDLNMGILLTAKREADPDLYDPQYLAALKHRKALRWEPEPIPDYYLDERQRNLWPSMRTP